MEAKAPASPKSSGAKFVGRSRAPRVQIRYEIENYGATNQKELPFIMGVLADLSGSPTEPLPAIAERKFFELTSENFGELMKLVKPRVAFQVPSMLVGAGKLDVDITFECVEDFTPTAVARKVETLSVLLHERQRLGKLGCTNGRARAAAKIEGAQPNAFSELQDQTDLVKAIAAGHATQTESPLLDEHGDGSSELMSSDAAALVDADVRDLDIRLSKLLDAIMHHVDFQKLEGTWRGLGYLVENSTTGEMLKIHVMNISKHDLGKTLESDWNQSLIFKKIYEDVYGTFGAEPFGCLIGDYYFGHTAADINILDCMGRIGAWAHTPFLAGASPMVVQLESWQELASPRDLSKIFKTPEYTAWRSLRDSEVSRYIGLVMPRILARSPYGPNNPVLDFEFEEDVTDDSHRLYTWANGVYALAININRSFTTYGWCSRIRGVESGSLVTGLPVHSFPTDDGGIATMCPTEVAIFDRRETELAKNGFIPLLHLRNTNYAAFLSVQSLWNSPEFDDVHETANARLAARLPYLFAACRFAHYLKCIARDQIGRFRGADDLERWLQTWIMSYVDGNVAHSSEELKSQKPLAGAHVDVTEEEGIPGHYVAEFFVRPQYQLEGLAASLRFVVHLRH